MQSLRTPISKIKCVLITPYGSVFNFCKDSCGINWLYSWKRIWSNSKCLVKKWCSFFRFYIWSNCKLEAGNDLTTCIYRLNDVYIYILFYLTYIHYYYYYFLLDFFMEVSFYFIICTFVVTVNKSKIPLVAEGKI